MVRHQVTMLRHWPYLPLWVIGSRVGIQRDEARELDVRGFVYCRMSSARCVVPQESLAGYLLS